MAITYLCALDGAGGFQKHVVVKMLDPARLEDQRYVHMFLDEARLWARLNHPSIPQAFELGDFHGVPYIVMEFVPGPTLHGIGKRLVHRPCDTLRVIARIGADVALALDYAHYGLDSTGMPHRVVHRDVTPPNVLVSTNGQAKLIDFGIALAEDRLAKTDVGILKGRLQYMAPEQLMDKDVDHRTDVFQLGATLYHIITGRAPFVGATQSTAAVWKSRMDGQFTPAQVAFPACPEELALIVHQCLEAQPAQRYARGSALAEALMAFANSAGAVDHADVAEWIAELYPNQEWNHSPDLQETPPSIQRLTAGSTRSNTPITLDRPPAAVRAGTIALATLAAGLVLSFSVLVGIGVLLVGLRMTTPGTTAVDPNRAASVYLEEAERLIAANRHAEATSFVLEARKANPTDPDLIVKLMRIGSLTQEHLLLAAAERALEAGDLDAAAARAREVLDRQPTHEEALALLAEVSATMETKAAAVEEVKGAKSGHPPAARAMGRLAVVAHPPARVFVDDRPYGTTPLESISLSVGTHTVHLRLAGHEPVKKVVTIKGDEQSLLDVALRATIPDLQPTAADATRIGSLIDAAGGQGAAAPTQAIVVPAAPEQVASVPLPPEPQPQPPLPPSAVVPTPASGDAHIEKVAAVSGSPAPGMTADVPLAQQALVLARALTFDTSLKARAGDELVLAALYTDPTTKKRAARMNSEFTSYKGLLQGMNLSVVAIAYTNREALAVEIASQGVDVLYLPTGMGDHVADVVAAARAANVVTLGAEPSFLKAGVSLGVFNVDGHPEIVLNSRGAAAEGASFEGEILEIAVIVN